MRKYLCCFLTFSILLVTSCGCLRRCHDETGKCLPDWCKKEVSIAEVWSKSHEYDGKEVCVLGKVVQSANFDLLRPLVEKLTKTKELAKYKVYILQDDEGKALLVHPDYSISSNDFRFYVNGKVNEFFRLGELSGLVV